MISTQGLREGLEEIIRKEGPYNRDQHEHASNVIDNMSDIAERLLKGLDE